MKMKTQWMLLALLLTACSNPHKEALKTELAQFEATIQTGISENGFRDHYAKIRAEIALYGEDKLRNNTYYKDWRKAMDADLKLADRSQMMRREGIRIDPMDFGGLDILSASFRKSL